MVKNDGSNLDQFSLITATVTHDLSHGLPNNQLKQPKLLNNSFHFGVVTAFPENLITILTIIKFILKFFYFSGKVVNYLLLGNIT